MSQIAMYARQFPDAVHSVASLAAVVGMGRSTFAKKFALGSGTSPMRFVQEIRPDLASTMLTNTSMRIDDIIRRIGFRDRIHFSRAFRAASAEALTNSAVMTWRPRFTLRAAAAPRNSMWARSQSLDPQARRAQSVGPVEVGSERYQLNHERDGLRRAIVSVGRCLAVEPYSLAPLPRLKAEHA